MSSSAAPKRLLVLTSSTGAGHDTHAYATTAWCEKIYGPQVEVTVAHELEESHGFYRGAVGFYNFIQRNVPWFHHIYYNIVELLELLNPGTVSFGRAHYVNLLKRVKPDAILSVHDCLNRGYFELAKEVLGKDVCCATYCTEFAPGYGFSRNWVNPNGDYHFSRTAETAREAIRRGVQHDRALVSGHWAPPAFYEPPDADERSSFLQQKLGLEPTLFTLLLSTGGAGAQNHQTILRALSPLANRMQVIALCGRDTSARDELEAWSKKENPVPTRFLSFTDQMPKLLRVSSAVVARAGATTAGEALLCGCPMIFNGLGLMMPQELPTWRYFMERQFGFVAYHPAGIRRQVLAWLDDRENHALVRQRMLAARDATTPEASLAALLRTRKSLHPA